MPHTRIDAWLAQENALLVVEVVGGLVEASAQDGHGAKYHLGYGGTLAEALAALEQLLPTQGV